MAEIAKTTESEYVRREVFDAHVQRIDQRFDSLEKRMDERFDSLRNEMMSEIGQLRSETKAEIGQLRSEMQSGFALLNERMEKNLAEYKAIALETRGEVRALAAHIETLEYWGAILIAAATIAFGITQYFQHKRDRRESVSDDLREQVRELRRMVLAHAAEASEQSH